MKNIKFITKILFVLVTSIMFISCNDDDDGTFVIVNPDPDFLVPTEIIGRWDFNSVGIDDVFGLYDHMPDCEKDYYEFKQDRTFKRVTFNENCAESISDSGDFAKNGEGIILIFIASDGNKEDYHFDYTLNEDKTILTLKGRLPVEGELSDITMIFDKH
ncbi:lipocalin family protein [Aureivirga marina]|uniref:lipocalin family protein n=1 Tax=Aureivirga marina TaxID=1182451 RepID=UPI0018CA9EDF|nr:lipocalin family protein [Aureivirga marina]